MAQNNNSDFSDDYVEVSAEEGVNLDLDFVDGFFRLDGSAPSDSERELGRRLVAFLRELHPSLVDAGSKAQALYDIGLVTALTFDEAEEALESHRLAYQLQPNALHIARGYRKALRRTEKWTELAAALESEANLSTDLNYKGALELYRGTLLECRSSNIEAARLAYLAALNATPNSIGALEALERIAAGRRDWSQAAERARSLARSMTDPQYRGIVHVRAARYLEKSGKPKEAMDEAVLARVVAPTSPAACFVLERLFSAPEHLSDFVQLREKQIADGVLVDASAWLDVGAVARFRLNSPDLALEAFTKAKACEETSCKAVALGQMSSILRQRKDWDKLVEVETERAVLIEDPTACAAAWHRIATIEEHHRGGDEEALTAYEHALEEDPRYAPALEGAGRIYARLGLRDRLLKMHLLEAEAATDDAARAAAHRRAGELLIEDEATLDEGIKHLQSALDAVPENALSMAALERALMRKGAWADLLEVYDRQLQFVSEPMQRCAMLVQTGSIAADHLGDRQRAIGAFSEAAVMAVHLPPEPLTRLAQLLEEDGDLDGLVVVLEQFVSLATEPSQVASLLERLASVHERRDDIEAAVSAYRRALEASPPSHPVYLSAGRAFLRAGRYEELAALFLRAAESGAPAVRAMWLHKAADVMATKLDRREKAIELLKEAATEAPDTLSIKLALEEQLDAAGRWEELREILGTGPSDGVTLFRRAMLAEANEDDDRAIELYDAAASQGVAAAVLPALRLNGSKARWARLVEQYIDMDSTPYAPVHSAYRSAELINDHLGDRQKAATILAKVIDGDTVPIDCRLELLRLTDDAKQKATLLRSIMEQTDDAALSVAYRFELASALESTGEVGEAIDLRLHLIESGVRDPVNDVEVELMLEARGDRRQSVEILRPIANDSQLATELRSSTWARIGMLLEELGAIQEAADALEVALSLEKGAPSLITRIGLSRLATILGDDVLYAEGLHAVSEALPPGHERATALRMLARHLELAYDDPDAAIESYEAALHAYPNDFDSLRELCTLLEDRRSSVDLIDHLRRAFSAEREPSRVAILGASLAVRLLSTGRLEQAQEVLDRTLANNPTDLRALMLSAELYHQTDAPDDLVDALEKIANRDDASTAIRLEAFRFLAQVFTDQIKDLAAARKACSGLSTLVLTDAASLGLRLAVQEQLEDDKGAALTLQELVDRDDLDEASKKSYLLKLSWLQENTLNDSAAALETLSRMSSSGHQNVAIERLLALGEKSGRWDVAAESLEKALESGRVFDSDFELGIRVRLAQIFEVHLERSDAAMIQYERIAELDPTNVSVLTRLAGLTADSAPERAIDYHRGVILQQPDRFESYRAMRKLFNNIGHDDGAFCIDALLEGLGLADEEEVYFYRQRRARLAGMIGGTLTSEDRTLICPEYEHPGFVILRELDRVLTDVFPVDTFAYGIREPGEIEGVEVLEAIAFKVAALFEIKAIRIGVVVTTIGPAIEMGSPPLLIIPRDLIEGVPREQLFVCGALLGRADIGGILGDPRRKNRMSPQQLTYVLTATCQICRPEYEPDFATNAVYQDIKRRIEKVLPKETRDAIAGAVERLVKDPTAIDAEVLFTAAGCAAARSGMLAAIDPAVAIACLRNRRTMFGAAEDDTMSGIGPEGATALTFAVSAEHLDLRKRLEIGVKS